jgi:hypothetical protein
MGADGRDNSNIPLKVAVRRWLKEQVTPHRVLDLYCGAEGQMYQHCWADAETYFGVDKFRPHGLAPTAKMSAEHAAGRLRLDDYTLFDVDCYDSPWIVARRILKRRGPGRFGLALTSGDFCMAHGGGSHPGYGNEVIRATLGVSDFSDLGLLGRYHDLVHKLMIRSLGEIDGIRLVSAVQGETERHIKYIGLIVDKRSQE